MMWNGKPIKDLPDDELMEAIISLGEMFHFRKGKLDNPRPRHKKIFANNPPKEIENQAFINLEMSLNTEYQSRQRKLENA